MRQIASEGLVDPNVFDGVVADVIVQQLENDSSVHETLDSRAFRRRHLARITVEYGLAPVCYRGDVGYGSLFER